jgi:hypothetical protein
MTTKDNGEKWICDYCKKVQEATAEKFEDYDDIICWKCECRKLDSWADVVHIPSMP